MAALQVSISELCMLCCSLLCGSNFSPGCLSLHEFELRPSLYANTHSFILLLWLNYILQSSPQISHFTKIVSNSIMTYADILGKIPWMFGMSLLVNWKTDVNFIFWKVWIVSFKCKKDGLNCLVNSSSLNQFQSSCHF